MSVKGGNASAFQQHIVKSLNPKTGRCAVLWPHGVLFRQEEADMRRKLIETDLIVDKEARPASAAMPRRLLARRLRYGGSAPFGRDFHPTVVVRLRAH